MVLNHCKICTETLKGREKSYKVRRLYRNGSLREKGREFAKWTLDLIRLQVRSERANRQWSRSKYTLPKARRIIQ